VGGSQWTNSSSNIYFNTGNVGIGTTSPTYKLHVGGTVNATGLFVNGSPVTSSQWNTSGPTINYTTGNVGIGTASPAAGLDVQTPINAVTAYGVRFQQALTAGNNNAELNGLYINPIFQDGQAVGVKHNALVTVGGNVGIGNSATSAGLDVQNAGFASTATNATLGTRFQQVLSSSGNNGVSTAVYINPSFGDGQAIGVRHNGLVVAAGDVGIGTSTPTAKLDVQGGSVNASGGLCIAGDCKTAWSQVGGSQWTTSGSSVSYNTGNVGIGVGSPTAKLEVAGNINVTGTGNITASGTITAANIKATYQDMAEWVESSQALAAGTVVVLDQTKSNQVIASSQAYDTRVAGVISAQPGIVLGERGEGKVLVATTGRVKVYVDATSGPIHVGDLLVTSDKAGVAMKSQTINVGGVQIHRPGTLIGKALESLESGSGQMLVLLSLQ
jgi:hypothetical protein